MKWDEFLPISELDTRGLRTLAGFREEFGIEGGRGCPSLEMGALEVPSAKAHSGGEAFSER